MTTPTPSLRPFEAELLPMLSQAAEEMAQRSQAAPEPKQWRRYVLVAAAGAGLAVAVPMLSDDPLRGALAIDRRGDTIYVSVEDAAADPEAMTNDLRAQGLPARVEVIPVSPSLEGNWVDIVNNNLDAGYNDPRISQIFEQIDRTPPRVLKIPADFSTPFTLVVGRPTEPGEHYQNALGSDVDHAYECLGLAGMSPDEASDAIRSKDYEPLWYYVRSDRPETEVLDEVPSDKEIVGAEFLGPTTVIVHTADPGTHEGEGSGSKATTQTAAC